MQRTWLSNVMVVLFMAGVVVGCGEDDPEETDTGVTDGMDVETSEDTNGEDEADTDNQGETDAVSDGSSGEDAGNGESPEFETVDCAEAADATEVIVDTNFAFTPSDVTIGAGEVVRWKWASDVTSTHDVVADNDADCETAKPSWFASDQTSEPGHTFCVRFQTTGTWNYQCTVPGHCPSGMKGTVTVE